MAFNRDDVFRAVRLVQWGLRSGARPAQESEYFELIGRFRDKPEFRDLVRTAADALDAEVLDVSSHGLVLGPRPESVLCLKPSEFLSGTLMADDRLIAGLIQVAIAACIYPRWHDLEADPDLARRPVSINDIEEIIREICARFELESRREPDPEADESLDGLYEAWRVYQHRVAAKETADDRRARGTTRRMIERVLDRLCDFDCFTRESKNNGTLYRPTRKYQVQVQAFAATAVFAHVQSLLAAENKKDETDA